MTEAAEVIDGSHAGSTAGWMEGIKTEWAAMEKADAAPTKETDASPSPGTAAAGVSPAPVDKAGNGSAPVVPAVAAAPAAPAKPAAEEEDHLPRTTQDWDRFKAKRKEREEALRADVTAREQQLQEAQGRLKALEEAAAKATELPPQTKEELDRLKKENEEYSQRLSVLEVTSHPKFQKYFADKTAAQVSLAKKIVGTELAEDVAAALTMVDTTPELASLKQEKIESIIDSLTPLQQSRLGSVLNALDDIGAERNHEIEKAGENRQRMYAQQGDQQKAMATNQERMFSEVSKKLQDPKDGFAALQIRAGDDAWNAGVSQRIEQAKNLLFGKGVSPEQVATAALHAASMPAILKSYQSDLAERDKTIATLQSQVQDLTGATPRGGGTAGAAAGGGERRIALKEGMNPFEASRAFAQSMVDSLNETT